MKCPICNDDSFTTAADMRPHLTTLVHEMDETVAKCIINLLERVEKLEQKG
jgi:hypothetical protein